MLLFFLVFLPLLILSEKANKGNPYHDHVGVFGLSLLLSAILYPVIYFLNPPCWETKQHIARIHSIGLSATSSGSFFLGSGTIDDSVHYYYYVRQSNGSLKLKDVSADESEIVRNDNHPPCIVTFEERNINKFHKFVYWPCAGEWNTTLIQIVVPTNAITKTYNVGVDSL
jgi:hypothetical protein